MRLQAGDRLGPYEIVAPIGAGGMGEVYRGRDARLDRHVAIKVLPAAVASDPERLARFEREAKTLAALNHPNVAQIYGTEQAAPASAAGELVNALAMEFVEGIDLSARIAQGALPVDDALEIASQIAQALEAAHEVGIIHRDLKPSNIRLREDGTVKVLDFGLAKALAPPMSMLSAGTSPTITTPAMTHQGMILGTAAYMAPEQARGKPADKRADIWAFGVILYEMTTGRRPFDGETVSDSLAAVMKSEPDWQAVPAELRRLLRSCLEKDPKKRLRDIGDWRRQLDDAEAARPATTSRRLWIAWSVAGALAVATATLAVINLQRAATIPQPVSLSIQPPAKATFEGGGFAVSPDGRGIVFCARGADNAVRAWIRDANTLESRPLPGTEGARAPSWSPDGRSIAFLVGKTLKRVAIDGGAALTIHDGPSMEAMGGPVWSPAGVLVFGGFRGGAIRRVPEAGGNATDVTSLDPSRGDAAHGIPSLLPDGRHFLYARVSVKEGYSGTYVGSIDRKPEEQDTTRLLAATHATYVRASGGAGYLLWLEKGTLIARPFDAERLTFSGEPVPVAEGVGNFGASGFFAAGGGTIVWRGGPQSGNRELQLTRLDRTGTATGVVGRPGSFDAAIGLSPDADRVAVMQVEAPGGTLNVDLRVVDLARGTSERLTSDAGMERWPTWSPDGERLAYLYMGKGMFVMPSRGGASTQLLDSSGPARVPTSWSRDGKYLLFNQNEPGAATDIWLLPMEGKPKPVPLVHTQYAESQGRFSPDGRWIAYVSSASGNSQIYVTPFNPLDPGASANGRQYSIDGGTQPRWGRDGKEVIFEAPGNVIMAVDLVTDARLRPGVPQKLFDLPPGALWDVSADGQRFLAAMPPADAGLQPINVLLHWKPGREK